jgi:23S rRNA pseudouridine1911/1915/1917 synthase
VTDDPDDEVDADAIDGVEERRFVVEADAARVDTFVAERVPELTRAQVRRLIDDGDVRVGGAPVAKAGQKLRVRDEVVVLLRPPVPIDVVPEDIALAIVFEDDHLIAIDKPAGMVVHPAPGHASGTLVNALLFHCGAGLRGIGGALRPGIVHRLDKDTSGVMVVAKDAPTHVALSAMFKRKADVVREYVAVVAPAPAVDRGTIRTEYGRHPTHRKKFSSKVAHGKPAITHWRVEARFAGGAAQVRCRLETGRTHQIRVHMADTGWPLLGDPLYGRRGMSPALTSLADALGRQALHAATLEFTHPITGARVALASPIPEDLAALVAALREGRGS